MGVVSAFCEQCDIVNIIFTRLECPLLTAKSRPLHTAFNIKRSICSSINEVIQETGNNAEATKKGAPRWMEGASMFRRIR
jgi:hypothetical protein